MPQITIITYYPGSNASPVAQVALDAQVAPVALAALVALVARPSWLPAGKVTSTFQLMFDLCCFFFLFPPFLSPDIFFLNFLFVLGYFFSPGPNRR